MLGAALFLPQWYTTVKQLTELGIYILKQEFPQLSLTEDSDIERYFEFRALNRQAEALKLYNTRLIHRYPDARMRVLLMTYYRKHDARFQVLLTDSLAQLADKTILQVKKIIVFFTKTIAPLKDAKVYTVIQVCEKVISAISADRFAAISFTEKYVRYAARLNYYAEDMRQAADMLRMYITDTISSVREFREERTRNAQEQNRLAAQKQQAAGIDFSKIRFTKEQIAAITIARSITRVEDQVLAYMVKYWDSFDDSAFENILLLYSRKYGTNHFSIFQAVKIGRVRKWKDEELIHAVLANVAQGYYYSISGDLYLQRAWKQLKLKLGATPQQHTEPAQKTGKASARKPVSKKTAAQRKTRTSKSTRSASLTEQKPLRKAQEQVPRSPQTATAPINTANKTSLPPAQQGIPLSSSKQQRSAVPSPAPTFGEERRRQKSAQKTAQPAKAAPTPAAKQPTPQQIYPLHEPKEPPLSIADTVKKITGKSYGVYRELFFKEVRSAIRTILQYSAVHKLSFFGTEQNNAEAIIYAFLETNYDNPYQQWQGSQDQADVLAQGFRIDSLEPIIRRWAQDNI